MAHVLIYSDDVNVASLLSDCCEDAGHRVTRALTLYEALMVLRTTLHPVVAFVDADASNRDFFTRIQAHLEAYGQHRYIATQWWCMTEDDMDLLNRIGVIQFPMPLTLEALLATIADAAASFSG